MFKSIVIVGTLIGTVVATCGMQEQEQIEQTTSKFMRRKLDYVRDIVTGLSVEDYNQIKRASQDLMLLSHETDWKVLTTPEYMKASSDFRETVARLRQAGEQKNLDGATIAYFEVTLNCVRCHKQLRRKPPNLSRPDSNGQSQ